MATLSPGARLSRREKLQLLDELGTRWRGWRTPRDWKTSPRTMIAILRRLEQRIGSRESATVKGRTLAGYLALGRASFYSACSALSQLGILERSSTGRASRFTIDWETVAQIAAGSVPLPSAADYCESAFDREVARALDHFEKPHDRLRILSDAQKFQLVCVYWSDAEGLRAAAIRDHFLTDFRDAPYHIPKGETGADRVRKSIPRGKALIEKL